MIIGSKQELRKCLKQLLRHLPVMDARLLMDMDRDTGLDSAMLHAGLGERTLSGENGSPLTAEAVSILSLLGALDLPSGDLAGARLEAESFTKEAWLREILDRTPAGKVLVRMDTDRARRFVTGEDRLMALVFAAPGDVPRGRYGYDYAKGAEYIAGACQEAGTVHIFAGTEDRAFLAFCLMPLCEDHGYWLHADVKCQEEMCFFLEEAEHFPALTLCLCADCAELERVLIEKTRGRQKVLPALGHGENYALALSRLGLHFLPYASHERCLELSLGRWIWQREVLLDALQERYLCLCRAGYELSSDTIEAELGRFLCPLD